MQDGRQGGCSQGGWAIAESAARVDTGGVPVYRDEAVVLRTHKLGEADRIVTLLSRQHGKIRAVAKGVRRTSSKFGSRLEPFMVVDAQFFEGRNLDTVTQVESLASYGAVIAGDYASYTAATAMVETADRITETEGSLQQYLLLVGALRSLSRREHGPGLTLDSYLLRALSIAGWAPSFDDCAVTGEPGPHSAFVVQLGGVVADEVAPPGTPRLTLEVVELLGALLAGDWVHAEASDDRARSQASGVVAAYTQWHLERGLRSLQHVDRVRDEVRREDEDRSRDRVRSVAAARAAAGIVPVAVPGAPSAAHVADPLEGDLDL